MASFPAWGAPSGPTGSLPAARDFSSDASLMRKDGRPLLVLFSSSNCGYCAKVEKEYLEPMQKSADLRDRLIFRVVNSDSPEPLLGFDGAPTTHRDFSRQHKAAFTPTVMLFNAEGRSLAPPLVGLTPEFYGAYLDRTIEEALEKSARN